MSALVNRSREEGAELRPFTGLEVFEDLLAGSHLTASTLYGEVEIIAGGSGQLNGLSVDKVGYRLKLGRTELAAINFLPLNMVIL